MMNRVISKHPMVELPGDESAGGMLQPYPYPLPLPFRSSQQPSFVWIDLRAL
jgi:hypothetical protein